LSREATAIYEARKHESKKAQNSPPSEGLGEVRKFFYIKMVVHKTEKIFIKTAAKI
jgi:hypothetical protein